MGGRFQAKRASDIPELDTSYFLPWSLGMLYGVEPGLEEVARRASRQKRRGFLRRLDAYVAAKHEAEKLVGWFARDPRLRSSKAWDCFFNHVLEELRL